ncbi:MAG TPA: DUF2905 domain-containing protein [Planctomycetes bacterium]|nr:DUF2905 domain-containing protein [Planctomycetota bacterium]
MAHLGKWLVLIGLGVVALGLIVWLFGKLGVPLGRLPGDVRIEGDRWTFHFPIVTCLVVSVVLTMLLNVLMRLFR